MQGKMKPIWLILSGVVTIGIGYGIYYLLAKEVQLPLFSSAKKTKTGFCKHSGFPLQFASCGDEIKHLQRYLNSKTRTPRVQLKEDGKMGSKTIEALKRVEGISKVSKSQFHQFKAQLNPFTNSII